MIEFHANRKPNAHGGDVTHRATFASGHSIIPLLRTAPLPTSSGGSGATWRYLPPPPPPVSRVFAPDGVITCPAGVGGAVPRVCAPQAVLHQRQQLADGGAQPLRELRRQLE